MNIFVQVLVFLGVFSNFALAGPKSASQPKPSAMAKPMEKAKASQGLPSIPIVRCSVNHGYAVAHANDEFQKLGERVFALTQEDSQKLDFHNAKGAKLMTAFPWDKGRIEPTSAVKVLDRQFGEDNRLSVLLLELATKMTYKILCLRP